MPSIPRTSRQDGPALLSYGFRPFFLVGALQAGMAMLVFVPAHLGVIALPSAFAPIDWHVHEMLYGFVPAVATGFLLTAIPNWTGRLPLRGGPLAVLVAAWLAGRIAVAASSAIGWEATMAVDVLFLALVAAACAREIAAGRNWRNLKVLAPLVLLGIGNAVFHLEAGLGGTVSYGPRIGIAATILLVMLIGGRIVPSFTRNWIARENPGRAPAPFGRFDALSLIVGGLALAAWIAAPAYALTGAALLVAGGLHAVRLGRWAGDRTLREPLVAILHVAYAFVPVGFVLVGLSAFDLVLPSAGIHAWTGGAIGTMTLAVMTRATRGHTGRPLAADRGTQALYALVVAGAAARMAGSLVPGHAIGLLQLGGAAFAASFLGFALVYGPALLRPRPSA
ncbi:NnrS family protein [Salinarimonas rosea]|uniref:NnrS family protein n=1 Tax=Salinarimonas rosea TaxID=552063 RepID=UPI00040BB636|nr:NnrS family protein [Salinarimonas rosea]